MPDDAPTSHQYTMGYSDEFRQMLDRRSADTHAAYLLPHLKTGQRLLDFGCGPGSISMGFARAIDPGELHGIDMEESQISLARAASEAGGHSNAAFHVGDVTGLPFEDDYFDVAHCHAVLMHVPDTAAVLSEVKRVLKPGGMIAARESILDACFLSPFEDREAWDVFIKLLAGNGGHPTMGKELKKAFLDAGFTSPRTGASYEFFDTPGEVSFFHGVAVGWFLSPEVVGAAIKFGLATQERFDRWRVELDQWKTDPASSAGMAFGECIAFKP